MKLLRHNALLRFACMGMIISALAFVTTSQLTGCNTVEGVGEDVEAAGEGIEDAGE
jgi:predicted small secreted protein